MSSSHPSRPMTSPDPADTGSIVSFYSFKGGVGRSMLLAHVAWVLASAGHKVLVVDWDLEAPGLREYFRGRRRGTGTLSKEEIAQRADGGYSAISAEDTGGVVDLISSYLQAVEELVDQELDALPAAHPAQRAVPADVRDRATRTAVEKLRRDGLDDLTYVQGFVTPVDTHESVDGLIHLMPAGRWDPAYADRMTSIDWRRLLDELGGDEFLARLRDRMTSLYDYVLIDSRTGISDTSGVCTTILPDTVVVCFSTNDQNVQNSIGVARYVRSFRDRRSIEILPVPCRVDLSNNAALRKARTYYERSFKGLVDHHPELSERYYWERVIIPYSARYSYAETPPLDSTSDNDRVLGAVEFLAKNITGDLSLRFKVDPARWAELLKNFERPPQDSDYQRVIVSYGPNEEPIAAWIEWLLREHGLNVRRQRADHLDRRILDQELELSGGDINNQRSGGTLCVMPLLSAEYVELPHAQETWRWARNRLTRGGCDTLFPVRVEQFRQPRPFDDPMQSADLVLRTRDGAREALLQVFGDRFVEAAEQIGAPEPEFPVGGREGGREYVSKLKQKEHKLAADGNSAERLETLLALAHRYRDDVYVAREYLDQAIDLARVRGDPLKEALAGFLKAALYRDADDVETSAREATDAVLALVERDVVGETNGRLVLLSDSDIFRDEVQELAAAMAVVRGRVEAGRLPKLALAAGIAARLVGDYRDARRACVEARFHATGDPVLSSRCDVEIGYLALLERRRRPDTRTLLDAARSLGRAARCTDPAVSCLATVGLGLVEQRRGQFEVAERRFEEALTILPSVSANESPEVRYRRSVVYTYLGVLSGRVGKLLPAVSRRGARNIAERFEPAVEDATPVGPIVSLPLAWALEKSCADDNPVPSRTKLHRALQALWIYYTLGFQDRMEECRRLAIRHDRAGHLEEAVRRAHVQDRGFVLGYVRRLSEYQAAGGRRRTELQQVGGPAAEP
jgi:tetratricopeptide (TPR) repeat protein